MIALLFFIAVWAFPLIILALAGYALRLCWLVLRIIINLIRLAWIWVHAPA